jgi:hypothetical protein
MKMFPVQDSEGKMSQILSGSKNFGQIFELPGGWIDVGGWV